MAVTERVSMNPLSTDDSLLKDHPTVMPGLRVRICTTSSSLSDYPEWDMKELDRHARTNLVTDGPCS